MNYRADIQGLRAVAVLAVIVFHLNPAWLPGGFIGVDIFLVISGYLIASILLHKKSKTNYSVWATLNYFYSSRFKRIIPAYYATLIVVSLLAALLYIPSDFAIYWNGLKQALWFNSNNYFANFGDYFAPANHEQPLLHTWSLAIEIQFYLIAPFIFLLISKKWLKLFLPASIITLTVIAEYRLQTGMQQATYYSLLARLPAFFLGAYVALSLNNKSDLNEKSNKQFLLSILAVILIIVALLHSNLTGHFPGISGLIPIVGAALIIWLNASNIITTFLSSKPMVWVGSLSYSLYLWHWPVLAFMRYYTGAEILDWQFSIAFVVLTFSLSSISYYFVETPMRQQRNLIRTLAYGCLFIVTLFTINNIKSINKHFTPDTLAPEYSRYADPGTICHGQIVNDCLKGNLNSEKEILVLGDSHAAMLNHFFDYLGKELNFKARIITGSSCMTTPGFDYHRIPEWAQQACLNQINEAKKHLSNSKMVFIAGFWSWQFESNEFIKSLHDFLKTNDKPVYLLAQEPLLKNNPLRAVRFSSLGLRSLVEKDHSYQKANSMLLDITKAYEKTHYLNFENTGFFNDAPFYNKKLIYFDTNHLNEIGSLEYAIKSKKEMEKVLSALLNK